MTRALLLSSRILSGFLALWLGAAMPLLCVPGVSSTHEHGPHWVFEEPSTEAHAPTSHSHGDHAHDHSHDHDPAPAAAAAIEDAGGRALARNATGQPSLSFFATVVMILAHAPSLAPPDGESPLEAARYLPAFSGAPLRPWRPPR